MGVRSGGILRSSARPSSARGRNRTGTTLRSRDFKSLAFTSFATRALVALWRTRLRRLSRHFKGARCQCRSIPTPLSGRHRWRVATEATSVCTMTIALDARDDVVALAFPTFPTRGRDGVEVLAKGLGMPRAEPLPTALWSLHECLCWRQEFPDYV